MPEVFVIGKKVNRKSRPINLNLTTIKFPSTAIVSILHRISGAIVFLMIPIFLWLLQKSLTANGFEYLQSIFTAPLMHIIFWLMLASLIFHLVAGIRHLIMDLHIGDGKKSGIVGAWLVFIISFFLILGTGIYLWW